MKNITDYLYYDKGIKDDSSVQLWDTPYYNSTSFRDSPFGQFNGRIADNYIDLPSVYPYTGAIKISEMFFWFKYIVQENDPDGIILYKEVGLIGTDVLEFTIKLISLNYIQCTVYNSTQAQYHVNHTFRIIDNNFKDKNWHMCAITSDDLGNLLIYFDSKLQTYYTVPLATSFVITVPNRDNLLYGYPAVHYGADTLNKKLTPSDIEEIYSKKILINNKSKIFSEYIFDNNPTYVCDLSATKKEYYNLLTVTSVDAVDTLQTINSAHAFSAQTLKNDSTYYIDTSSLAKYYKFSGISPTMFSANWSISFIINATFSGDDWFILNTAPADPALVIKGNGSGISVDIQLSDTSTITLVSSSTISNNICHIVFDGSQYMLYIGKTLDDTSVTALSVISIESTFLVDLTKRAGYLSFFSLDISAKDVEDMYYAVYNTYTKALFDLGATEYGLVYGRDIAYSYVAQATEADCFSTDQELDKVVNTIDQHKGSTLSAIPAYRNVYRTCTSSRDFAMDVSAPVVSTSYQFLQLNEVDLTNINYEHTLVFWINKNISGTILFYFCSNYIMDLYVDEYNVLTLKISDIIHGTTTYSYSILTKDSNQISIRFYDSGGWGYDMVVNGDQEATFLPLSIPRVFSGEYIRLGTRDISIPIPITSFAISNIKLETSQISELYWLGLGEKPPQSKDPRVKYSSRQVAIKSKFNKDNIQLYSLFSNRRVLAGGYSRSSIIEPDVADF